MHNSIFWICLEELKSVHVFHVRTVRRNKIVLFCIIINLQTILNNLGLHVCSPMWK